MKKLLIILLILICSFAAFAGVKPYLKTLDLHPGILGGWCPTYAGVGSVIGIPTNGTGELFLDAKVEGGITERAVYQNPKTGEYIDFGTNNVLLMDIVSFTWGLDAIYDLTDKIEFKFGYQGSFENRKDSMFYTNNVWPKSLNKTRWIGGSEKASVSSMESWLSNNGSSRNTTVFPEFAYDSSYFSMFKTKAEYNAMYDSMVANDGLKANSEITYAPGFINRDASFLSFNTDVLLAKVIEEKKFASGLNMFAVSILNRTDFNFTFGSKVPTSIQQSISLGRKVRGFNAGSYARAFTLVNNFEIRFSSPELMKGVFMRTNLFFDCGIGFGKLFNCKVVEKFDYLASIGIQEQIDYMDAFDLGIQVAYLLNGKSMTRPYDRVQVCATFFLDF